MRGTLKKMNFFVEEDIRKVLDELVPDGQKSKVINEALQKELLRIKREKATGKLMPLKSKGTLVSNKEIVEALKKDRRCRKNFRRPP